VLAAHEEALSRLQLEFLEAYRAMNRLGARVLAREPEPMLRELSAIANEEKNHAKAKGA
jgi:hypothetical protein